MRTGSWVDREMGVDVGGIGQGNIHQNPAYEILKDFINPFCFLKKQHVNFFIGESKALCLKHVLLWFQLVYGQRRRLTSVWSSVPAWATYQNRVS